VLAIAPIDTGHSGFTYWVTTDLPEAMVLRLAPPGVRIAGPADVARQGRIMRALTLAGLPVPRVIDTTGHPTIDGRPFILLEKVDGERIEAVKGRVADEALAGSAVAVLRRLHRVPLAETGIADEAPVSLETELHRWNRLIEHAPPELRVLAPKVAERLRNTVPGQGTPALIHGDYHYGNLLFKGSEVAGVVDWEIAALGQPLVDLASLALIADAGKRGLRVPGGSRVDASLEFVVETYGAKTTDLRWFLGLAYFKLAAIFGYNLMLHRRGKRHDPHNESRAREVGTYLEAAREVLGA